MVVSYAYSKKYNYIIGWNAKSGCSSFRDLFLYLHADEVKTITHDRHLLQVDFPLPKNINNIPIFILVRNPYSRLVSCFTNKYCSTIGHALLRNKMTLNPCNYKTFINELKILETNNKLNDFDVHVQKQTHNLLSNATILKLENYNSDIIKMYNHKNLVSLLPKVKEYIEKTESINKTTTYECNIQTHSTNFKLNTTEFPPWVNFYGPILKDQVYELYKNDFIIFNYSKNFYSPIYKKEI